jgi:TonB-linked SusC/RagA family outer membrane protein
MKKWLLAKRMQYLHIHFLIAGLLFGILTAHAGPAAVVTGHTNGRMAGGKSLADSLTGKVTDEHGQPMIGVTVKLKVAGTGTLTNSDGLYALKAGSLRDTLAFSYIGYQSKEIAVDAGRIINVVLTASPGSLNDVVVIGYGTQKRATLTGAVDVLKGSEIVKSPMANVSNSLAGRLPGVIINNRTGEPGRDDPGISIRGRSTTGNASALVVIDGVERAGLGQINPNDIESITVLKDASAAIYGARAANGVILVTTKRGSLNTAPTIDLSFNQGFTGPTRSPKMADSYTFFNVYNEIEEGEGRPAPYTQADLDKFRTGADAEHANFDWYKFLTRPFAPQHRSDIAVYGGNNTVTYRLSFGELMQDGQYKFGTTKIKQYNLRSNVNVKVADNFNVGMDIAARFDNDHYPYKSMNDINSHIFLYQPNWVPYWPGTDYLKPNRDNDNIINRLGDDDGTQTTKTTTFQTTLKGQWDLPWIKGLSVSGSASYDPNVQFTKTWYLPDYVYYQDANGNYSKGRSGSGSNMAQLTDRTDIGSLLYMTSRINYTGNFGDHHVTAMMAYEQQTIRSNYTVAYRGGFPSPALPEIFAGSSDKNQQSNDGAATQGARKNYFGRITYDFARKYLAEVTVRRDGSPNFPAEERWGTFPSVLAGWVLSQENFLKHSGVINYLKVRASYGVMGNDLVDPFQYLQNYTYGNNYVIDGKDVTGLVQTGVPNPNITWERAKTGNAGLDATLWNGKLGITFDYFKTRRSDILTKRSAVVPGYTGLSLPDENIGIVDNKGFELVLTHVNNDHLIKYNFSGNVSFARNKVIFSDEQPAAEPYQLATGRPIGAGLYYKAIGIFKDEADIAGYPNLLGTRPGDIKYEDVNHDGEINSKDQVRVNQTNVPEITFGFTANFSYKAFDLSLLLQGQANAQQNFGGGFGYFPIMSYAFGNFLAWRADGRWTPEHTNATMPRGSYELFNNNTINSTQWLVNAGFLKLRNVELGYTLPQSLVNKAGIKKLRVYASGSNLLTLFDKMKQLGFDPETSDYWYYPPQRVFNFGANVTF